MPDDYKLFVAATLKVLSLACTSLLDDNS